MGFAQRVQTPRLAYKPIPSRSATDICFSSTALSPCFLSHCFFGEEPQEFVAGQPFRYVSDCTWYMNAANGFDMQHFLCVHGRELVAPCQVDCPDLFARRNRYRADIVGDGKVDRFLRRCVGSTVDGLPEIFLGVRQ